jgi:serpin B
MPFDGALSAHLGRQSGNYVASPASIALGLAMAREGARGETAAAFDHVLGDDAREVAKELLRRHAKTAPDGPVLSIANRLFCERSFAVLPELVEITRRDYGAAMELVDFIGAPQPAREHINAWVAEVTRGKIHDLLPKAAITTLTRLVLVDAVYLKATWATKLDKDATYDRPFEVLGAGPRHVPTMHGLVHARWGEHAGARLLELPYRASDLVMLCVVPDAAPLAQVEAAYAETGIVPFAKGVRSAGRVSIALPKFQARTAVELKPALIAMGLGHAFGDDSDFAGIAPYPPLQISAVAHQAWVDVDEAGTEAAAATAVVLAARGGAPRVDHSFAVDRSFLFFIHDGGGNVLFGGRVIDPTAR